MQKAGVDVGINPHESCCGGRAYQLGYRDAFLEQARQDMAVLKDAGVKTLVTACAECYHAYKVLYDKFNLIGDIEVLHASQFFAGLLAAGRLKPARDLDLSVTYHDPCHLGRLGEPYIHWEGKQLPGHIRLFDPPREFRRGSYGVYGPPREVLAGLPGVRLTEMARTREYAWCCGAGGGVAEYNPSFAAWTAAERVREAESTGAGALVTACPGCENAFHQAAESLGGSLKVYDLVEIIAAAVL
jgi:Fe-S oxidoreductase